MRNYEGFPRLPSYDDTLKNPRKLYEFLDGYFKYNADYVRDIIRAINESSNIYDNVSVTVNSFGAYAALYLYSDGTYKTAKADSASTMPCCALALTAGTGTMQILKYGTITNSSWAWTEGGLVYVDASTAGALTQTRPAATGNQVQIIGMAKSVTELNFDPHFDIVEIK